MSNTYRCYADRFRGHVKRLHRIPQDADTWKRFRVRHVSYDYNRQGYYEPLFFGFSDGSWFRVPDNTTSEDDKPNSKKELKQLLVRQGIDINDELIELNNQLINLIQEALDISTKYYLFDRNRTKDQMTNQHKRREVQVKIDKLSREKEFVIGMYEKETGETWPVTS